jgi:hypothetical protein
MAVKHARIPPPVLRLRTWRIKRAHARRIARRARWSVPGIGSAASAFPRRPCCVRSPRARCEHPPEQSVVCSCGSGRWAVTSARKSNGSTTRQCAWWRGWTASDHVAGDGSRRGRVRRDLPAVERAVRASPGLATPRRGRRSRPDGTAPQRSEDARGDAHRGGSQRSAWASRFNRFRRRKNGRTRRGSEIPTWRWGTDSRISCVTNSPHAACRFG